MSKQSMLRLRNVSKRYSGGLAVDAVSFAARPGEITGYLGPNGSGKSTTIKMINPEDPRLVADREQLRD